MKKAQSKMWWIIAGAILALIVVILILVWFKGSGDKAFGEINNKIGSLRDCDGDNAGDLFDKCPCDVNFGDEGPNTQEGENCNPECSADFTCVDGEKWKMER